MDKSFHAALPDHDVLRLRLRRFLARLPSSILLPESSRQLSDPPLGSASLVFHRSRRPGDPDWCDECHLVQQYLTGPKVSAFILLAFTSIAENPCKEVGRRGVAQPHFSMTWSTPSLPSLWPAFPERLERRRTTGRPVTCEQRVGTLPVPRLAHRGDQSERPPGFSSRFP